LPQPTPGVGDADDTDQPLPPRGEIPVRSPSTQLFGGENEITTASLEEMLPNEQTNAIQPIDDHDLILMQQITDAPPDNNAPHISNDTPKPRRLSFDNAIPTPNSSYRTIPPLQTISEEPTIQAALK
jgi:hypothetical protein